jgi:very-short-patch-repair endonuclease
MQISSDEQKRLQNQLLSWRDKLLDLNRRNKLININVGPKNLTMLGIIDELPIQVYEHLSSTRRSFSFLPNEQFNEDQEQVIPIRHEVPVYQPGSVTPDLEKYKDDKLQTNLSPKRLQTVLSNIQRRSKSSIEEQGFNTLYIAIGVLEWYENPGDNQPYNSPLVLMPVELSRKDFGSEFRLKFTGDETVFNPALVQKFISASLPNLSTLQEEIEQAENLDLKEIFSKIYARLKIDQKPNWRLKNQVVLGLFSFTKFMMYNDMKRYQTRFESSSNVQKVCGVGSHSIDAESVSEVLDAELDKISVLDFHAIMDADSSQLRAILAAKNGVSLILQGPPGTGKSQTIANIIGECIAAKKTVLFVSEKMAALNVVYDRLASKSLARYALELHSHKAHKKTVIRELERCLDHRVQPGNYSKDRLKAVNTLRDGLNKYGQAILARRGALHRSFYEIASKFEELSNLPPVLFEFPGPLDVDQESLTVFEEMFGAYENYRSQFGKPGEHVYKDLKIDTWDLTFDQKFSLYLQQIRDQLSSVETAKPKLESLGFKPGSYSIFKGAKIVLGHLQAHEASLSTWYQNSERRRLKEFLYDAQKVQEVLLEERDQLKAKLEIEKLSSEEAQAMIQSLRKHMNSGAKFLLDVPIINFFFGEYRRLRKDIFKVWKHSNWTREKVFDTLQCFLHHLEKCERFQDKLETHTNYFPKDLHPIEDKVSTWVNRLAKIEGLEQALTEFIQAKDIEALLLNREKGIETLSNSVANWDTYIAKVGQLEILAKIDPHSPTGLIFRDSSYQRIIETCDSFSSHKGQLKGWLEFNLCIQQITSSGFLEFAEENWARIERGKLHLAFRKAFYMAWISAVQNSDDSIKNFSLYRITQFLDQFRSEDSYLISSGPARVQEKVHERLPTNNLQVGEPSKLKTEAKKQRKIKPIRKLFAEIPNLITTLKPVFLMSPLSVAMYLDPEEIQFDVVIFDEASQIYPEDAIGALVRAKQMIVVGDSKQMPPTNFFNSSKFGEDTVEEEEQFEAVEMESILDFCDAALCSFRLKWHYRSKHEYLIAFSNRHFYENRLITFPSTAIEQGLYGLFFHHIEPGRYDAGKSRTNQIEAEAVANRVCHLVEEFPGISIGVIAMSQAQQDCILNLLESRAIENRHGPLAEQLSRNTEGLFVKNLENVQGDERDVILLSIGYGIDYDGKLRKAFGPINKEGGERRLNVAISRSRKRMEVFCSFQPGELDLSGSKSRGAHLLKSYLTYCQNPGLGARESYQSLGGVESPFEENVQVALEAHGIKTHTQIGCSGFRIDLGAVHPYYPGKYILGIECDGAAYHSSQIARDRDRLRQAILEDMGWTIYRIWSTDWIARREDIIDEIQTLVNELSKQSSTATERFEPVIVSPEFKDDDNSEKGENEQRVETLAPTSLNIFVDYQWAGEKSYTTGAEGFKSSQTELLAQDLLHVIRTQAPIAKKELFQIVASYWGMSRVGAQVERRLESAFEIAKPNNFILAQGFVYKVNAGPIKLRKYPDSANSRSIESYCPEELEIILTHVLKEAHRVEMEELIKYVSKCLGFSRTGAKIMERLSSEIEKLCHAKKLARDGDAIELVE